MLAINLIFLCVEMVIKVETEKDKTILPVWIRFAKFKSKMTTFLLKGIKISRLPKIYAVFYRKSYLNVSQSLAILPYFGHDQNMGGRFLSWFWIVIRSSRNMIRSDHPKLFAFIILLSHLSVIANLDDIFFEEQSCCRIYVASSPV